MKNWTIAWSLAVLIATAVACIAEQEGSMNIFSPMPQATEGPARRKLADDDHLLMMQVMLKPGQRVPQHNADSNVRLLVLEGDVVVSLAGEDHAAPRGSLVPVKLGTSMHIRNDSEADATFLVIKTPHPARVQAAEGEGDKP